MESLLKKAGEDVLPGVRIETPPYILILDLINLVVN